MVPKFNFFISFFGVLLVLLTLNNLSGQNKWNEQLPFSVSPKQSVIPCLMSWPRGLFLDRSAFLFLFSTGKQRQQVSSELRRDSRHLAVRQSETTLSGWGWFRLMERTGVTEPMRPKLSEDRNNTTELKRIEPAHGNGTSLQFIWHADAGGRWCCRQEVTEIVLKGQRTFPKPCRYEAIKLLLVLIRKF